MAIADRAGGALLGDCAVHVLADQPRTAEIGVTLAPGTQGRGVGREALDALVTALFADYRMHRVIAQVDERNHAMQRLCERLGLRLEATFVEADWFKGEWDDAAGLRGARARVATGLSASVVEDRQVELAQPLGVGEDVDRDDPAVADGEAHDRERLAVARRDHARRRR